jgi:hypothetical protein
VSSGGGRRRSRRLTIDGHSVRIVGAERVRPFRGFFSGDDLPVAHQMGEGAEAVAARGARAELAPGMTVVEVDGRPYELHARPAGWFHSHTLPFKRFETAEAAARELVRLTDLGVLGGRP